MKRKLHPADGLYYIDADMLERTAACWEHKQLWKENNGEGRVPVTLTNMTHHMRAAAWQHMTNGASWLINHQYNNRNITLDEYDSLIKNSWRKGPEQRARDVMDALRYRARREGKL